MTEEAPPEADGRAPSREAAPGEAASTSATRTDAAPTVAAADAEAARQTETARRRWLEPVWRADALAWIEEHLGHNGLRITGQIEQPRIRPWATGMVVPTNAGTMWFKACGPGNAYEPRLVDALVRWGTPRILAPLAVDADRGWMLSPDGGPHLRDMLDGGAGIAHWERILPEWAEMQRRLAPRAEELIELGVPDLRPAALPAQFAALIEDPDAELSEPDQARLRAFVPTYTDWCAELAASAIAPSLQHDDLHDGNVFVGPAGDTIFDWGDSSVAHPFGTLLVTFRSIANRGLGEPVEERRVLTRLRDAYLEPWTVDHARADLAATVSTATRVAIVGRALSWQRGLLGVPPHDRGEWAGNIGGWLLELFEPAQS